MPIPPMKPSAYERAAFDITMKFNHLGQLHGDSIELNKACAAAIEQAHRDGIAAAIAALREPSDTDIRLAAFATCPDTQVLAACLCPNGMGSRCWDRGRAALTAAADVLEKGVKP